MANLPQRKPNGYSPHAVVLHVHTLLVSAGIIARADSPTAVIAAADLLRALGVDPATAPELPKDAP